MTEHFGQSGYDGEKLVADYVRNPRADLKDLIIVHYAPLVERTARKFAGLETVDDLTQVGYIGLLNALSKFDPDAGVRFNTYATHLVAGEIKHYLRDKSQTIRTPAWLQELRTRINRSATELQAELSRVPVPREIAERLGISEETVTDVLQTHDLLRVTSLDATPSTDEEGESDVDRLDAADFSTEQLSVEDRLMLEQAMQELRDLERDVLTLFHFDMLNQTEIATQLGISCNYVSHILRQSLNKLRRILTRQQAEEAAMRLKAGEDPDTSCEVTGVYGDRYFRRRLTEEIHRAVANGGVVSAMIIRFEGLDRLAGFFGAQSANDVLADAADLIKSQTRALDIVCRYGKDGFGIILPATGPSVAVVRERLVARFSAWAARRLGPQTPVRVTINHAVAPDDGRNLKELLRAAREESLDKAVIESPKAA